MLFKEAHQWTMDARWQGETHRIVLNGKLDYQGPLFSARLNPDSFEPDEINAVAGVCSSDVLSLEPVAAMYVLLNGLRQSLPHLPTALPDELAGTGKIAHPGYAK